MALIILKGADKYILLSFWNYCSQIRINGKIRGNKETKTITLLT